MKKLTKPFVLVISLLIVLLLGVIAPAISTSAHSLHGWAGEYTAATADDHFIKNLLRSAEKV